MRPAAGKAALLICAALFLILAACSAAGEESGAVGGDAGTGTGTDTFEAEAARLRKSADTVQVDFDRMTDGDTIWVFLYGVETEVRLIGIDTPDTDSDGKTAQPWGAEAGTFTEERLSGAGKVYLEFDDAAGRTDAYGRTQAWVWADHSLLQEELLERGLAKAAHLPDGCKYRKNLLAAQETAKTDGTGLWGPW